MKPFHEWLKDKEGAEWTAADTAHVKEHMDACDDTWKKLCLYREKRLREKAALVEGMRPLYEWVMKRGCSCVNDHRDSNGICEVCGLKWGNNLQELIKAEPT